MEETYLHTMNDKPTENGMLNGERLKVCIQKVWDKVACLFNTELEVYGRVIRQKKEIKCR